MNDKTFFPLIQVWRACAAALVTYGHIVREVYFVARHEGQHFSFTTYPTAVGVDLFFVISGFVIVYASRELFGKPQSWRTFLSRRFFRIVPLYWLYTSLAILALFVFPQGFDTAQIDIVHFIKSYLFIPHERPSGDIRPVLSLGWSLNYEVYFYLVFGALLFLPLKIMIRALSAYFVLSALIGFWIPEAWISLKFWFSPYVLEFTAGALVGYAYLRGVRLQAQARPVLIAFGMIILSTLFYLPALEETLYAPLRTCAGLFAGSSFVAAACLPAVDPNPASGLRNKIMRPLIALGNSSYSLYLAHPFMIGALKLTWSTDAILTYAWPFIGSSFIACLICGHGLYIFIEKPLLRFARPGFVPLQKSVQP